MKQLFFRIVTLAALALFALGQPRAFALTTADVAGSWLFTVSFTGETPFDQPYIFDATGNVYDPNYGGVDGAVFGTVTVNDTSFAMTLTGYDGYVYTYTGNLDVQNATASGSVTQDAASPGGEDLSGTFTAVGTVKQPTVTTGTLTYRETDKLYVIGTTQFSITEFTATGSISLNNFPNTDPNVLVLPDDVELNVSFGVDQVAQAIYGGRFSDALLTNKPSPSKKAFLYQPFSPDIFFDGLAALKIRLPKTHKTGAATLTAGWIFTGPHNKPATGLKFSIIGVGRGWQSSAGGGSSNVQGLTGTAAGRLGHPSEKDDLDLNCVITFGNASKNVTASFKLAGPATVDTKDVTPKDTKSVKESTVTVSLKGPVKPPS
ncbi:MAG: hypothetical protein QOE70_5081 [Chthoniobacter sp.]|nr:hypothetical protein [Chthoniobacter sp.]